MARLGKAWQGLAKRGAARHGGARRGKARQGVWRNYKPPLIIMAKKLPKILSQEELFKRIRNCVRIDIHSQEFKELIEEIVKMKVDERLKLIRNKLNEEYKHDTKDKEGDK